MKEEEFYPLRTSFVLSKEDKKILDNFMSTYQKNLRATVELALIRFLLSYKEYQEKKNE